MTSPSNSRNASRRWRRRLRNGGRTRRQNPIDRCPELQHLGQVAVKSNGHVLPGGTLVDGWPDLPSPPTCVHCGPNAFEVTTDVTRRTAAYAPSPSQHCGDAVVS